MDFVATKILKNLALQTLVGSGLDGPLFEASVGLVGNDLTPSPETVLGDITVPTWTAYAPQVITWNTPTSDGMGGFTALGDSVQFTSGANADQFVYGYYIFNGASLLLVQLFDEPAAIEGVRDIMIIPRIPWV